MAITCPKCGGDNPETVKFCGECGTALVLFQPPTTPSQAAPRRG